MSALTDIWDSLVGSSASTSHATDDAAFAGGDAHPAIHADVVQLLSKISFPPLLFPLNGFTGRDIELRQLDEWYERTSAPVAVLCGISGVGKSWLWKRWATERAHPAIFINVSSASADVGTPSSASAAFIERLAFKLGHTLGDDLDADLEALSSLARSLNVIIVIDPFEPLLVAKANRRATNVGKCDPVVERFLQKCIGIGSGSGRILLVSNLQPIDIVTERSRRDGTVTVITGPGTDADGVEGLASDDAIRYLREFLNVADNDERLGSVSAIFDSHPLALNLFAGLSPERRASFLNDSHGVKAIGLKLQGLLAGTLGQCSSNEIALLDCLAVMKRAELLEFVADAAGFSRDVALDGLNSLRHRSLVEYGLQEHPGFSVHAIVSMAVQSATDRQRLREIHRGVGTSYGRLHTRLAAIDDTSARDESGLAVFHFEQAQDLNEASYWRRNFVRLGHSEGRSAYADGRYDAVVDVFRELIEFEAERKSPLDDSRRRELSTAHFQCASATHRQRFSWESEYDDVLKALTYWPTNGFALTFVRKLIIDATRGGVQAADIQTKFAALAAVVAQGLKTRDAYLSVQEVIGLLDFCGLWYDRCPDLAERAEIITHLKSLLVSAERLKPVPPASPDEGYLRQICQTNSLLSKAAKISDERLDYAKAAVAAAEELVAAHAHLPSARLLLATVRARLGDLAETSAERVAILEKAALELHTVEQTMDLPRGYLQTFAMIVEKASRYRELEDAVSLLTEALAHLQSLRGESARTRLNQTEWYAARVQLLLRLTQLDEHSRARQWKEIDAIVWKYLDDPSSIDATVAEALVDSFGQSFARKWSQIGNDLDSSPMAPASSGQEEWLRVKKKEFHSLNRALWQAEKARGERRLSVLRLRLGIRYLENEWRTSSPDRPRIADDVESLAHDMLVDMPGHDLALIALLDYWKLVIGRTYDPEAFSAAVDQGIAILDLMNQNGTPRPWLLERGARFKRRIMEYSQALADIRPRMLNEPVIPSQDTDLIGLYLDILAHTIQWEAAAVDSDLLQEDCWVALGHYNRLLRYFDTAFEDLSKYQASARAIWSTQCRFFVGEYDPKNLDWFQDIDRRLRVGASWMENPGELIGLRESPDPLAKVLGYQFQQPATWREIGSLFANFQRQRPDLTDMVLRFYDMADWFHGNVMWKRSPGKGHGGLILLDRAQYLLRQPPDSDAWKDGADAIREAASERRMPWIYQQFVERRWGQISAHDGPRQPSPAPQHTAPVPLGETP